MTTSYAVNWADSSGSVVAGKLELRSRTVFLEGSNGHAADSTQIRYDDLAAVRVARGSDECIAGRPTLVVERRGGETLRIASVGQAGVVMELADQIVAA